MVNDNGMLRFTKMNGAGNDFVVIDNRAGELRLNQQQIAAICDRHRGIGADGVLLVEKATNGADFRMRYYNRDGGEAEMCGNGARCFARFAQRISAAPSKLSFETPAGKIEAELDDELVRLTISEPRDIRLHLEFRTGDRVWHAHFLNTGVPHVVVPVSAIAAIDVERDGSAIRHHQMFAPAGANVNFLEKRAPNRIAIRTFERGVESETLACGTGVVASALVFALSERAEPPISVLVRGGSELMVDFQKQGNRLSNVVLTGPAEFVFEGTIEL